MRKLKLQISSITNYREVILLFIATLAMTAYMYLNPPLADRSLWDIFGIDLGLAGDLDLYVQRFLLATIFLGLIPFITHNLLGYESNHAGLVWRPSFLKYPLFYIALVVFIAVGIISGFDQTMFEFYPFSKTIVSLVLEEGWIYFIIHALSYLFFYYLPWELLFRGVLVFSFLPKSTLESKKELIYYPHLFLIAAIQTLPTTLMHLPHPVMETIGAIIFGLVAAYVTLRSRSIIPVIILHASLGLTLDLTIILRHMAMSS
jgi:membrane protease YdiL (CAAX protease family)